MKTKVLLTVTVMCIFSSMAVAQIKKGALLLGGQVRFSNNATKSDGMSSTDDQIQTGFTFTPVFGRAIKDNLIVGVSLLYAYSNVEYDYFYKSQTRNYGAGLFVRKYRDLGKGFFLFGEANIGRYSIRRTNFDRNFPYNDGNSRGYTLQLGLNAGLAYSVTKRIQLEAGLGNVGFVHYNREQQFVARRATNPHTYKSISLGSSLSSRDWLNIGFRVLLN